MLQEKVRKAQEEEAKVTWSISKFSQMFSVGDIIEFISIVRESVPLSIQVYK